MHFLTPTQAETDEGYPVKMDKKSLNRLLDKLSKGGFLKNIIVKLKCDKMVKVVNYVVHPSITFGELPSSLLCPYGKCCLYTGG